MQKELRSGSRKIVVPFRYTTPDMKKISKGMKTIPTKTRFSCRFSKPYINKEQVVLI